jgi:epoxyqueuosine reductase QueG
MCSLQFRCPKTQSAGGRNLVSQRAPAGEKCIAFLKKQRGLSANAAFRQFMFRSALLYGCDECQPSALRIEAFTLF